MKFKTPELQGLLSFLCTQYPKYQKELMLLEGQMAEIDLSIHCQDEETFRQPIDLITDETIELTWNIDKVIEHSKLYPEKLFKILPYDILQSQNFCFSSSFNEIYEAVKEANERGEVFEHKVPYIIVAKPLFTEGNCIIDGNHRFAEAILMNNKPMQCFTITGDNCTTFLQKDSQAYINILKLIHDIIGINWRIPSP